VIRTSIILFDEEKMDLGCKRRRIFESCVECDDRRAGFSARVFARPGKAVNVKDFSEFALAEDDHPRLQIPLQKLVLRPRMRPAYEIQAPKWSVLALPFLFTQTVRGLFACGFGHSLHSRPSTGLRPQPTPLFEKEGDLRGFALIAHFTYPFD
jgi:hypothetical protein